MYWPYSLLRETTGIKLSQPLNEILSSSCNRCLEDLEYSKIKCSLTAEKNGNKADAEREQHEPNEQPSTSYSTWLN